MSCRNIEILKSEEVSSALKAAGIDILFDDQIKKLTDDDFENSGIEPESGRDAPFMFKVEANHPFIVKSHRNHPEGLPFYVDAGQPTNPDADFFWSPMGYPVVTEAESIKEYCDDVVNL